MQTLILSSIFLLKTQETRDQQQLDCMSGPWLSIPDVSASCLSLCDWLLACAKDRLLNKKKFRISHVFHNFENIWDVFLPSLSVRNLQLSVDMTEAKMLALITHFEMNTTDVFTNPAQAKLQQSGCEI